MKRDWISDARFRFYLHDRFDDVLHVCAKCCWWLASTVRASVPRQESRWLWQQRPLHGLDIALKGVHWWSCLATMGIQECQEMVWWCRMVTMPRNSVKSQSNVLMIEKETVLRWLMQHHLVLRWPKPTFRESSWEWPPPAMDQSMLVMETFWCENVVETWIKSHTHLLLIKTWTISYYSGQKSKSYHMMRLVWWQFKVLNLWTTIRASHLNSVLQNGRAKFFCLIKSIAKAVLNTKLNCSKWWHSLQHGRCSPVIRVVRACACVAMCMFHWVHCAKHSR